MLHTCRVSMVWAETVHRRRKIVIAFLQRWKAASVVRCVLCHRRVKTPTHKGPYSWHEVRKGPQPKGMVIIFLMRPASVGLLSIPDPALPASQTSLEICLAASMLGKALIAYLSRSSVLQDNKLYLIWLCSLMSQLKGLVLPLSMRLAESISTRASRGFGACSKCAVRASNALIAIHIFVSNTLCLIDIIANSGICS